MQTVADRPRVDQVRPPSHALAIPRTRDGATFARSATIATALALFPWSLLILFLAWLF